MVKIYVHVVLFVADGRRPFDESIRQDVATFIQTVLAYKGLRCLHACVLSDHVHLALEVPSRADVFAALETLRYWLQDYVERHTSQPPFAWQERMWVVSKSPSDLTVLEKYFRRQADYHDAHSLEQEWEDMMDLEEIVEDCRIAGV
jgi:REP element-mobilizing transposase RayT